MRWNVEWDLHSSIPHSKAPVEDLIDRLSSFGSI